MITINRRSIVQAADSGRTVASKTVIRTLEIAGPIIFSAEELTTSINAQIRRHDQQLTEKQVTAVLTEVVKRCAWGERYTNMRGVVTKLGNGWYEYR